MSVPEPLDFWNYPDWLGDTRDNPRSPGHEPFWMRPPKIPTMPGATAQEIYDARTHSTIAIIHGADGEVFTTRIFHR
jgi:hypothetical protein